MGEIGECGSTELSNPPANDDTLNIEGKCLRTGE